MGIIIIHWQEGEINMPEKEEIYNHQSGKLSNTSQNFRVRFLLLFTKELLKHSKVEEFFELQNVIKKEELPKSPQERRIKEFQDRNPELMPSIMDQERKYEPRRYLVIKPKPPLVLPFKNPIVQQLNQISRAPSMMQPLPKIKPVQRVPIRGRPMTIPEHPLPPPVRYITPTPSSASIDLGKINLFVNDPSITSIESNGPNEPVTIKTPKGAQSTKTVLNKEEINEILQSFSEASRIPMHEGVLKIAVGKLILSAIVSDVIGSRFIIKKMQQQSPKNPAYGMMRRY